MPNDIWRGIQAVSIYGTYCWQKISAFCREFSQYFHVENVRKARICKEYLRFCLRGTALASVPLHFLQGTLQTPVVCQDDREKKRLLHSSHAMGRWNAVRKKEGKFSKLTVIDLRLC